MDTVSVGEIVRLPHGEAVKVEVVYDDREARLRRIEGDRAGTVALCRIESLKPLTENIDLHPER